MRAVHLLLMFLFGGPLFGTSIMPKSIEDLVADSDHIVIATVTSVKMFNGHGRELTDPKSQTGPGISNEIRWQLSINPSDVLYSKKTEFPREITLRLWTMWHATLENSKSNENQRYIFLLKGDDMQWVYPGGFYRKPGEQKEIEEFIRKKKTTSPNHS